MPSDCHVEWSDGSLSCRLPITMPTSKVRVLRDNQPVATRQTHLSRDDVVEWQISYFANKHTELVELGKLLELAYRHQLVGKQELERLLGEIEAIDEFFTERCSICIENSETPEHFHGFKLVHKTVPILLKDTDGIKIWIELRHKQRAVGSQPMLFLRIPISQVFPSLVGRMAGKKQIITWKPGIQTVMETIEAFAIASEKHHGDMLELVRRVIGTD